MTAREMFNEIGFNEVRDFDDRLEYRETIILDFDSMEEKNIIDLSVVFYKNSYFKEVKFNKYVGGELREFSSYDVNLHLAVHQQWKEWGWIE